MSVSLAAKLGSRERLKVRRRCGCMWCARQMPLLPPPHGRPTDADALGHLLR
jgi:hypothetical protein